MATLWRSHNGTFCPWQRRTRPRGHELGLNRRQAVLVIRAGTLGSSLEAAESGPGTEQQSSDCAEPSFRRSQFHRCELT